MVLPILRRSILGTGATPAASFMLLSGLWATFMPASANTSISLSSIQTQWTAMVALSSRSRSASRCAGFLPYRFRNRLPEKGLQGFPGAAAQIGE